MESYFSMDKEDLVSELGILEQKLVEFKSMGLKLDMSRGKPSCEQLDLSLGLLDIKDYKDNTGVDARNYGNLEGAPEAINFFAEFMGVTPAQTIVGGNASLQIMYAAIDKGWRFGYSGQQPWGKQDKIKFICPVPGYDRHFRISESFGIEMINVDMTPDGPDMDQVEKLVQDESVKGIWCVPVYSNPDGYVYSDETVKRLSSMKTAKDFRVIWDNAYAVHHLTEDKATCLNLLNVCIESGNADRALMFYSTSKITFSGAGVGAVACSENNRKEFLEYLFPVAISFDKMNQLRHVRFLKSQAGVAEHMKKHAAILKPKFDAVNGILEDNLGNNGGIARWTNPKGGYFISLYVMDGCAKRVVDICKQAGVVLTGAGAAFPYGKDPKDNHIRIAPSFPPIGELETAAELLCLATKIASIEKLIEQK